MCWGGFVIMFYMALLAGNVFHSIRKWRSEERSMGKKMNELREIGALDYQVVQRRYNDQFSGGAWDRSDEQKSQKGTILLRVDRD